jgi:pimeloyl-ACP methyl ester carboxylesterase
MRWHRGRSIEVPITVAFGDRERLLPRSARLRGELPAHTRWVTLPGCGHRPMSDAPDLVAGVILEGTTGRALPRSVGIRPQSPGDSTADTSTRTGR